jgi:hypothetical protein
MHCKTAVVAQVFTASNESEFGPIAPEHPRESAGYVIV